ncbi:hypothetical protein ACQ5SO_01880 [Rhodovulum sp. DZ06]|uniref:hypothetical protein n=1 Tax=Rhodovulum sp. DZ06 TaxID=3425126 RepID=UPI003D353286
MNIRARIAPAVAALLVAATTAQAQSVISYKTCSFYTETNFKGAHVSLHDGDMIKTGAPAGDPGFLKTWTNIRETKGGALFEDGAWRREIKSVIAAPFCTAQVVYGIRKSAGFTAYEMDTAQSVLAEYQRDLGGPALLACLCTEPK